MLSPRSLDEIYKRYEFNKTEPETLLGLIESVIEKSDEIKGNFELHKQLTETVYNIMVREEVLQAIETTSMDESCKNESCLGDS